MPGLEHIRADCYGDFLRRAWGLMLRRPKPVLLLGVREVHTFLVVAPIYVVFLREEARAERTIVGRVVGIELARPWRRSVKNLEADHALELPANAQPPRGLVEVTCS